MIEHTSDFMATIRLLLLYFSVLSLPFCSAQQSQAEAMHLLPVGKITVFIHGTIFPVVSPLMNLGKIPPGLNPLASCKNGYKRIGTVLTDSAPDHFPKESFYCFGWSGDLDFQERKRAALDLYDALKSHSGPLTIIAHSHGCNVALSLAAIAEQKKGSSLEIDLLILLAAPVQIATADYVSSKIFKKIISCYSTADLIQIADPQGMYSESKKVSIDRELPFFSRRKFSDQPHLTQARILLNRQSPAHIDFIQPRFLSKLPAIITLLDTPAIKDERNLTLNIPPRSEPHIMKEGVLAYVPRGIRGRTNNSRTDELTTRALNA